MSENFIRSILDSSTDIKLREYSKLSPSDQSLYKVSYSYVNPNPYKMLQTNGEKTIIIHNKSMFDKIAYNGALGFAESYMDGDWDTDNMELILYTLMLKEVEIENQIKSQPMQAMYSFFSSIFSTSTNTSLNTIESSKDNISHHYDIGNDLYKIMLDKRMQYTCAYFHKENMSLEEAQLAKMELIAKKLDLKSGMSVVDIGCGFGGMAYHLASKYGVRVTGVTLSAEQQTFANNNFGHPNVKIILKDYRHLDSTDGDNGMFDRVYSIGMFEHVGRKNYSEYYDKCYSILKPNGIMLLHTIGRTYSDKFVPNPFVEKYIFPGGELPRLKDLTGKFIDKWHLEDMQNLGLSYAKTLRCWRNNIGNWKDLDRYSNRFRKMWNFYLLSFPVRFEARDICLWQLVYTKHNNTRPDDLHYIRKCN
jgi:cyclopropane-fatty-acyl-phospholipid synthase